MSEPVPTRRVDIAEILRDARLGDPRRLRETGDDYDSLHAATDALFGVLLERQVQFVVVGGMALLQYVAGRNTRDIDIIMAVGDLDRLPEFGIESGDRNFARLTFQGVQVDILLTVNSLFELVRERYATLREFNDRVLPCATPDGLVLLKLFALPSLYREGDVSRIALYEADIRMLLADYEIRTDSLLDVLTRYLLTSDVAELRKVVEGIRRDIARARENPFGWPDVPGAE